MSNQIALASVSQLPAKLQARIGAGSSITDDMIAGSGAGFKRISKRNGRFRIRDGKNETVLPSLELKLVIVGANPATTKTFFKGSYDPNSEEKGPDCWSNDGIRPASDVEDPQSQLCANCPQNVWGSKVLEDSNQKLKACMDQKKLAVIFADDKSQQPEVYLYQVSPSELNGFHTYGKELASHGIPIEVVVTKLSFDDKAHHPKVLFNFGGWVNEEMLPVIDDLVGTRQIDEITGKITPVAKDLGPAPGKGYASSSVESSNAVEEVEVEVLPRTTVSKARLTAADIKEPPAAKAVRTSNLTDDLQDILNSLKNQNVEDAIVEEIE